MLVRKSDVLLIGHSIVLLAAFCRKIPGKPFLERFRLHRPAVSPQNPGQSSEITHR